MKENVLESSELEVLTNLGLTPTNARIYLTLANSEPLKVSAIAEMAKVARPDTYRAIENLQKMGLIEKIIENPVKYKASPLNQTLQFLLETKKEQYKNVIAETEILLNEVKLREPDYRQQLKNFQFTLITEGNAVIRKIREAINSAESSVDLVLSWRRFSRGVTSTFAENLENAWKKQVKFRFLVQKPKDTITSKELTQFCRRKTSCQVKFMRQLPETVYGIYDNSEMSIILFPRKDLPNSPALWSNSNTLIKLASDHFEMLWNKAKEV
jgi:sugar-specific transcriptional regulator TrmB